jgi:hypothetical protein
MDFNIDPGTELLLRVLLLNIWYYLITAHYSSAVSQHLKIARCISFVSLNLQQHHGL